MMLDEYYPAVCGIFFLLSASMQQIKWSFSSFTHTYFISLGALCFGLILQQGCRVLHSTCFTDFHPLQYSLTPPMSHSRWPLWLLWRHSHLLRPSPEVRLQPSPSAVFLRQHHSILHPSTASSSPPDEIRSRFRQWCYYLPLTPNPTPPQIPTIGPLHTQVALCKPP